LSFHLLYLDSRDEAAKTPGQRREREREKEEEKEERD
jgi:hypothetical protein